MLAKYKGQIVEVWEITHRPVQEVWVKEAFQSNVISWNEWNKNVLDFGGESGDLALVGDFLILDTRQEMGYSILSKEKVQSALELIKEGSPTDLEKTLAEQKQISSVLKRRRKSNGQ